MTDIERIEVLKRLASPCQTCRGLGRVYGAGEVSGTCMYCNGRGSGRVENNDVLWLIAQIPQWKPISELPESMFREVVLMRNGTMHPETRTAWGGTEGFTHWMPIMPLPTPPTEAPSEKLPYCACCQNTGTDPGDSAMTCPECQGTVRES